MNPQPGKALRDCNVFNGEYFHKLPQVQSQQTCTVQYTMLEIVEMGLQFCSCSSQLEGGAPHHLPPWEKPAFHTLSQRHQNCEIYKYLKEETSSHVKEVTYLRQKENDLKKIKVMYLL